MNILLSIFVLLPQKNSVW